jgi:WD repeat-containing protein 23
MSHGISLTRTVEADPYFELEFEDEFEDEDEDEEFEGLREDDDDELQRVSDAMDAFRANRLPSILFGFDHQRRYGSRSSREITQPVDDKPNEKGQLLMGSSDFGSVSSCKYLHSVEVLIQTVNRKVSQDVDTTAAIKEGVGHIQFQGTNDGIQSGHCPITSTGKQGGFRNKWGLMAVFLGSMDAYADVRFADHDHHCYIGQFSVDGNFFYSCDQDMKVRMFDTSDPYDWKYYKTVDYIGGK